MKKIQGTRVSEAKGKEKLVNCFAVFSSLYWSWYSNNNVSYPAEDGLNPE